MESSFQQELEKKLLEARSQLERRLGAIQGDRRRKGGGLDRDFEEQAVQRENDETLDALDARGRQELREIDAALDRISKGRFGRCLACGGPITSGRLQAEPTAENCIRCASHT